jgi:hypothetical protein
MIDLLLLTSQLKGASFGNILGYTNDKGEVSNHHVNFGMNYGKAKADDFETVMNANIFDLVSKTGFSIDLVSTVIEKMKKSLDPNVPKAKRSQSSKGQSDAYTVINSCFKIHNKCDDPEISEALYIYAYGVSKEVIVEGSYGEDTRGEEVKCKTAVQKALKLKTAKYKNFKIKKEKFFEMKMMGDTLILGDVPVTV